MASALSHISANCLKIDRGEELIIVFCPRKELWNQVWYWNRAVEKKEAWSKIREICAVLAFPTKPFPTVGGGHVLVSGSDSQI